MTSPPHHALAHPWIYIQAATVGVIAILLLLSAAWGAQRKRKPPAKSLPPSAKDARFDAEVKKLIESVESEIRCR
jgi:hypothetical protein